MVLNPGYLVAMKRFRGPVPLYVNLAFKEPAAAAKDRVVASVTQVVPQVVHRVQLAVAIPASEVRKHFAGEWMGETRNP